MQRGLPLLTTAAVLTMWLLVAAPSGAQGSRVTFDAAYEIDLKWGPDDVRAGADAAIADMPPILTAIQEQLGLTLQPTRGPVAILVIDSVQRPARD